MQHQASDTATSLFRQLAEKHGNTELGRLARLSLALQQSESITGTQGGGVDAGQWEPVADELARALEAMPRDHPLREEALFNLGVARMRSAQPNEASAVLEQLQQSYPRGKWARRGARLKDEGASPRQAGDPSDDRR
jgi:hypothetical protein